MNLCYDGHEEVCYDCRHCPVCEIIKDNKDYVDKLQDEVKDLTETVEILDRTNAEYLELFKEVQNSYPEFAI